MEQRRPERVRLLGAEVDLITPAQMLAAVDRFVADGRNAVVANHNSHSLYLFRRSAAMQAFFAGADLVEIDSTPMIAWGRVLGLPVAPAHRCTYLDWRDDFWRLAARRSWRVFYLGGAPGVAETAADRLRAEWPGVQLAVRDGYFSDADSAGVVDQIRAFDPHIVMVGMGMPRQETWIQANRGRFARGVFFSVGAAFDYEAGAQKAAPRWTGPLGVEWLWRLAGQPRRLAHRYLIEPWFLAPAAIEDLMALARRPDRNLHNGGAVGAGGGPN